MAHPQPSSAYRLDEVLRQLNLGAQQMLVGSLPPKDALRLRLACKTTQLAVDASLTSADVRLRATAMAAADRGDDPAWWGSLYSARLRGALDAIAKWPRCARVLLHVVTPGPISDTTAAFFAQPFCEALADGLHAPHVSHLELYMAEPAMVERSDRCFSGPPIVLTPQLTQKLSGLFPGLESLVLQGPCWAAPDLASAHIVDGDPAAPGLALAQPAIANPNPRLRATEAAAAASAAFAALGPERLPRLRHLAAPLRVVASAHLAHLQALTSLHVDCNPGDHEPLREMQRLGPAALHALLAALPAVQHLTVSRAYIEGLLDFAVQRPAGLRQLSVLDSHIRISGPGEVDDDDSLCATEDTRLALDWARGRLEIGDPRFELPDVVRLVARLAGRLGLRSVHVSQMQIRPSHVFSQQELTQAAQELRAFAATPPNRQGGKPAAGAAAAAVSALEAGVGAGRQHAGSVRFGALNCASDGESVGLLTALLRDVGPCEELQLAGGSEAALAGLAGLAAAVPAWRLPVRLGLEMRGSPEWGWQLLSAMAGLRRALSGWPPVECLFINSSNCDAAARSGAGLAGRSSTDWITTLLMASTRLHLTEPPAPTPDPADGEQGADYSDAVPSASCSAPCCAPSATAATLAAAAPAAEAEPALRAAPGFWCALAVPVAVAADGGGGGGCCCDAAVGRSLAGVLHSLPPHVHLHAGRCTVWHSHGGSYHKRNKHTLWLAATPGPRPGLALEGVHSVRFEYVGAGRRGPGA